MKSRSLQYYLEKELATHSRILAWRIPWTEEPGGLQYSPWGRKESDTIERLTHTHNIIYTVHKKLATL